MACEASRKTVLMVGKGAPDRGGIPTFLETLLGSRLARDHDLAADVARQLARQHRVALVLAGVGVRGCGP